MCSILSAQGLGGQVCFACNGIKDC
jgi:hypothetical protein